MCWAAVTNDGRYAYVTNFGDGTISAFDLTTLAFDGRLHMAGGGQVTEDGLWGLIPGNGQATASPNKIYFTAGLNDEADGLFGSIAAGVPEPATWVSMILGFAGLGVALRKNRSRLTLA